MLSAIHTILDFESSVDSIDVTAALISAGYTGFSTALDGNAQDDKIIRMSDVTEQDLALAFSNDSSLDNMVGGIFDESSHTLSLFTDTNPDLGVTEIDGFMISVGDDSTIDDDDIVINFESFIA